MYRLTLVGKGLFSKEVNNWDMIPIPVCLGGTEECCRRVSLVQMLTLSKLTPPAVPTEIYKVEIDTG